jgi:hypothetical protein
VVGFFISSSNKDLAYNPWSAIDVALLVVLGFFVFHKSRAASTLLVFYSVAGTAIAWSNVGNAPGLLVGIIFFLYYITAMRGTYIWHASYRDAPPITVT